MHITVHLIGLAAFGHALPHLVNEDASPLLARQAENPDKCKPARGDANAMREVGADKYLSDYLSTGSEKAWENNNWLASLDEKTTQTRDGGPYHSTLNCTQIEDKAHCQIPDQDVQCREFTPPEVYWIRLWAPNVQTFFDAARNSLVEETLIQSLSVNKLTEDFDLGDMDKPDNSAFIAAITYMIAPLLSFSSGVKGLITARPSSQGTNTKAGMVAEGAALFGNIAENIAGGANLMANLNSMSKEQPPTPRQLAVAVESVLKNFFTTTRDRYKTINRQFFQGLMGDSNDHVAAFARSLSDAGAKVDTKLHPVAQVLGSGEFATGGSGNLGDVIRTGFKNIQHQMIGAVLAAQGVVLFGNTKSSQEECQGGDTRWWDQDVCYSFERVRVESDGRLTSQGVDDDKISILKDTYDINIPDMMDNIRSCENDFGRVYFKSETGSEVVNGYGRCQFGMAYFKAEDEPCKMWPGPYGYEHGGCGDSFESFYWDKFKNGEEVQRQGTWPGKTVDDWMVPDL